MELPDLKALKKLIKLCQKEGVKTVRVGELELHLGEAPRAGTTAPPPPSNIPEDLDPWEGMTDEQKLLWSALPTVSDDAPPQDPALPSELRDK